MGEIPILIQVTLMSLIEGLNKVLLLGKSMSSVDLKMDLFYTLTSLLYVSGDDRMF